MRIVWRDLELPTRVVFDEETLTETYGRFEAEPFERGFGNTIGNSLRRVLLSSLSGSAVTTVKIEGVQHEFSSIKGVLEDVTEIILNIKSVLVKLHTDEPVTLRIEEHKKKVITAGDIKCDEKAEIVNPDHVIATLNEDVDFVVTMEARKGRGYVTAEENSGGEQEIGIIPVDSTYSPVRRVRYKTADTRVGKMTNYDKLEMEIWTDGTINPEMALVEASKILRKHFNPFVQYFTLGESPVPSRAFTAGDEIMAEPMTDDELRNKLNTPIAQLELSVRSLNCLEREQVATVRDLVRRSESELLRFSNLGKTSAREIKQKVAELGLQLGMEIPGE